MQDEQLLRLIRLAKKTGDTLIVTDPEGDGAVAIMDIDRYEALLSDGLGDFMEEDLPDDIFEAGEPTLEVFDEKTEDSATEMPESVENSPISETEDDFVDEERFYLEPIE